jgi:hypothetical protein
MGHKEMDHPMLAKKKSILEKEGVKFVGDQVSEHCIYHFDQPPLSSPIKTDPLPRSR